MTITPWTRREGHRRPPDELIYATPGSNRFPAGFRTRVMHWARATFLYYQHYDPMGSVVYPVRPSFEALCRDLAEAYGQSELSPHSGGWIDTSDPATRLDHFLTYGTDFDVLDVIDGVIQEVRHLFYADYLREDERETIEVEHCDRMNTIFEEEGIGYRFTGLELVRFDDVVSHAEAIAPAVELLRERPFGQANAEFTQALEHYRAGHWRDAITNANAAFESTLKVATGRDNGTAGELIAEARDAGIIPAYLGAGAENLGRLMNVVPAVRGQQGSSHGLGARADEADQALARLVISCAAAFIVFVAGRVE